MENKLSLTYKGESLVVTPTLGCYEVKTAMDIFGEELGLEPSYKQPLYGLALQLHDDVDKEQAVIPTVNLGEFCSLKNAVYIDVNNFGMEMVEALEEAGVLTNTGLTKQSGWVSYPLCTLTDEFVAQHENDEAYRTYSNAYDEYFQTQMEHDGFDAEEQDFDDSDVR